jgi:hypothetical protein
MPACIEKLRKIYKTLPAVPKEALEDTVIEAFVLKRIKGRIQSKWSHNFATNTDGIKRRDLNLTRVNNYRYMNRKPLNKWTNQNTHKLKPRQEVMESRMTDLKTIMDSKIRIYKKFEREPIKR